MSASTILTNRRRIRRSEETWRELLVRFERSGQTCERFCAEQGLALSSFTRWRQKLRSASHSQAAVVQEALFVELGSDGEARWDVELQLGAGVVLRVRRQAC